MNKQSKKVKLCVIEHAALKNNQAYLLRTGITETHQNNRICWHCGVKTSTVTPSFYYVFNISSSCNNSIPSFIRNLRRVLLLGNRLKALMSSYILCKILTFGNKRKVLMRPTRLCMRCYCIHWYTAKTLQRSSFFTDNIMVIIFIFFHIKCVCSDFMVLNSLESGSSILSVSPARSHCVMFLGNTFYSDSQYLFPPM